MTTTEAAKVTATNPPLSELANVTKTFPGNDVEALRDISLDVNPGDFISFVGPSGCGKSTVLRLVAGLLRSTSGSVRVRGQEVTDPRQDTALMFQQPILLPWKTTFENVVLPNRLQKSHDRGTEEEAGHLLEMLSLNGFRDSYPQQLSGGMQQRAALARLLMTHADILLMDEPFAALDEFTRERLNLELLKIKERLEATILFVTHNISEAVFLADKVVVMTARPGRIAELLQVPLPRPRERAMLASPELNSLVLKVREALGENT